jgi:hypothetical protein
MFSVAFLTAALIATGCDNKAATSKAENKPIVKKEESKHVHGQGPNGGIIFDLGAQHAEFTVDHEKKECAIFILDGDDKNATPLAVAAKELTVTTKATRTKDGKDVPAMTIKALPKDTKDGKATKFVGTDAGLGNVAEFEGTVIGEIDGKPSQGEFKE